MPDHIWWYLSRASGIVTLAASGGAIIWGLLLSTRLIRRRSLPRWLLDLHRFLGAVSVLSLGVHMASLWADSFVHFSVADLTVPGHTTWHPFGVALGIVAAYLLVAVELSSLAKRWISRRLWHLIHLASFPIYLLALVHASTAGTDTSNRAYVVLAIVMSGVITFLTILRFLPEPPRGPRGRPEPPRSHTRQPSDAVSATPV